MAVAPEGHRALRDAHAVLAQGLDCRLDRAHAQRDMRVARIFLAHVHQDVLAAAIIVGVEDEVELDAVAIAHHRHCVVGSLVLELEAEHAVELHGAIKIAHAHADMVHRGDIDAFQFSSLKPMALTILPHFACSLSTNCAYSCGELGDATPPTLANCPLTVADLSAVVAAPWTRFWIAAGVALGMM